MGLERITQEAAGIDSSQVQKFVEEFENLGIAFHSLLLAKGDRIFGEAY